MSTPINELPLLQQKILIIMRRQECSTQRIAISLKAEGLDCPEPSPHLQALAELEFVTCEPSAEEALWSLTDKGRVAAELLWFDDKFGDTASLFRAMSGI
jgi:hypothetical protein